MRNVSRCWAYETGLAAGVELGKGTPAQTDSDCHFAHTPTEIPMNEYYEYFGPDYELDVKSSNMDDMNSPEYLDRVKNIVLEHLRQVGGPPSVQMSGMCFRMIHRHDSQRRQQTFPACLWTRLSKTIRTKIWTTPTSDGHSAYLTHGGRPMANCLTRTTREKAVGGTTPVTRRPIHPLQAAGSVRLSES